MASKNSATNSAWAYPFNRRQALKSGALASAGLAALGLAGCASKKQPAVRPAPVNGSTAAATGTANAAKQPKRGGTLKRPVTQKQGGYELGLDAQRVQVSHAGLHVFMQTLLVTNPRSFAVESQLAQKWEQPSPTEYVFHLQPNVHFHNKPPASGRLLTADDVVFSMNRFRTNDPKFINRSLLANADQIVSTSPSEVKLTTTRPDASMLVNLASPTTVVFAPEVVAKAADKFATADVAVGTGPFILQALDDVSSTLVANPTYWKPGLPYLDSMRLLTSPDDQVTMAAFTAGQLDVNANLPGSDAAKFIAEKGKDYFTAWFADVSIQGTMANVQRKPFDDPRVTQALRLLIDHQEAVKGWAEVWFGRGYITAALPSALVDWDLTQQEYTSKFLEYQQPKDKAVKAAIDLLSAAGFTKDNPLKFTLVARTDPDWAKSEGELLQGQYKRLGQGVVQVEQLRILDGNGLLKATVNGDFDCAILGLVPGQAYDPDPWLRTFFYSKESRNYGKFSDPTLDKLIDKQQGTFDLPQRKAQVKDIIAYLVEHAPYSPWSGRYQGNAAQIYVKDWAPEANSAIFPQQYENVWFDR